MFKGKPNKGSRSRLCVPVVRAARSRIKERRAWADAVVGVVAIAIAINRGAGKGGRRRSFSPRRQKKNFLYFEMGTFQNLNMCYVVRSLGAGGSLDRGMAGLHRGRPLATTS